MHLLSLTVLASIAAVASAQTAAPNKLCMNSCYRSSATVACPGVDIDNHDNATSIECACKPEFAQKSIECAVSSQCGGDAAALQPVLKEYCEHMSEHSTEKKPDDHDHDHDHDHPPIKNPLLLLLPLPLLLVTGKLQALPLLDPAVPLL